MGRGVLCDAGWARRTASRDCVCSDVQQTRLMYQQLRVGLLFESEELE